jgi:hypothetical protein
MLRIPSCLDNWFPDRCDIVRLAHRPRSTAQKLFLCVALLAARDSVKPHSLILPSSTAFAPMETFNVDVTGSLTTLVRGRTDSLIETNVLLPFLVAKRQKLQISVT